MPVDPLHLHTLIRQHAGDLTAPAFIGGGFFSKLKSGFQAVGNLASRAFHAVKGSNMGQQIAPILQNAVNASVQRSVDAALTSVERGNYRNIASSALNAGRNAVPNGSVRRQLVSAARQALVRPVF